MEHPLNNNFKVIELGNMLNTYLTMKRNVTIYIAQVIRLKSYTQKKLKITRYFSNYICLEIYQNNFKKSRSF